MSGSQPNVVTFDFFVWQAIYPEFSTTATQAQASGYFDLATVYCDNSPFSFVRNLHVRARILGLLTAHIAKLFSPERDGLVGRIANASQGSVSVGAEMPGSDADSAWFMQTAYGASAYQAMAAYRIGGRYIPGAGMRAAYGRGFRVL